MAALTYSEVSAISYVTDDIAVLLSPAQQSLAIQAMALFTMPHMWSDWDTQKATIDELVPATLLALETPVTIPPNTSPYQHDYFHLTAQNNIGNNITQSIQTGQVFNHAAIQSPAALNDEWFSPKFWLKAGIYVADFYFVKGAGSGIVTLEWRLASDNSVLTSAAVDLYSAAGVLNFKSTLGHTLAADTLTYLRGKMLSKNASSSGYSCALTCCLVRS